MDEKKAPERGQETYLIKCLTSNEYLEQRGFNIKAFENSFLAQAKFDLEGLGIEYEKIEIQYPIMLEPGKESACSANSTLFTAEVKVVS